jgi:sugar phosphate isomerase/epimerase
MQRFPIGAVTDVFSPDIAAAAPVMRDLGLKGAELRTIAGHNILEATDEELDNALTILAKNNLEVVSIASPLLKGKLGEEQPPHLTERAFEIAERSGAKIVRVFSHRRVAEPDKVFERIVDLLQDLADKAARRGLIVGLENDHSCNISTAQEMACVLAAIDHSNLQAVWDPANAYISGEKPFPTGYRLLDIKRIAHVHAKDCTLEGHKAVWEPLGDGDIDWQGQIDALAEDGYQGFIHLETYGPDGRVSAANLRRMVASLAL